MNILFLSPWFPYPPNNGSRIRVYNLIKQLSKEHDITLLSFIQNDYKDEDIESLKKYCKEVKTVKGHWFNPKGVKALFGFFSLTPRYLFETYNSGMQSLFDEIVQNKQTDLIICSQLSTVLYALHYKKAPKIFEEVEVSVIRDSIKTEGLRKKLTWWKLEGFVKSVLSKYDGYTVVSNNERRSILEINPSPLGECIPNGIDTSDNKYLFNAKAGDLIYSGSLTYTANFDAMEYFLKEIFTIIKKENSDIKLKITGSTTGVEISKLKLGAKVELTGYVNEIKPLIYGSAVCIVPLRQGGGTRLKILEAMALGTPVVSTSKGAEGIEGIIPVRSSAINDPGPAIHDFNIWIEDAPEKFAKAVMQLVKNRIFAERLAINARKLVEDRYDWNKISGKFEEFIEKIIRLNKKV